MLFLGYMNEWTKDNYPAILDECEEKEHEQWYKRRGSCVTEYGCDKCGYCFYVDSSD